MIARKPYVTITTPGKPATATEARDTAAQPADDRVALTV